MLVSLIVCGGVRKSNRATVGSMMSMTVASAGRFQALGVGSCKGLLFHAAVSWGFPFLFIWASPCGLGWLSPQHGSWVSRASVLWEPGRSCTFFLGGGVQPQKPHSTTPIVTTDQPCHKPCLDSKEDDLDPLSEVGRAGSSGQPHLTKSVWGGINIMV